MDIYFSSAQDDKPFDSKAYLSGQVLIGSYTYAGSLCCRLYSKHEKILIGSFCSIADQVVVMGGGNHRTDRCTTYPLSRIFSMIDPETDVEIPSKATVIGSDCWIGMKTTILPGLEIGHGSVIGACSVVTRDVPPYHIAAGNPARIIRSRFSETVIQQSLQIQWWSWPITSIHKAHKLLYQNPEYYSELEWMQLKTLSYTRGYSEHKDCIIL